MLVTSSTIVLKKPTEPLLQWPIFTRKSLAGFARKLTANSGISERHPETAGRTRESTAGVQAIAGDGGNPLNPAGLATRTKKRRALSRSAFCVNRWVAKVRSRLKGSLGRTRAYASAVNSGWSIE